MSKRITRPRITTLKKRVSNQAEAELCLRKVQLHLVRVVVVYTVSVHMCREVHGQRDMSLLQFHQVAHKKAALSTAAKCRLGLEDATSRRILNAFAWSSVAALCESVVIEFPTYARYYSWSRGVSRFRECRDDIQEG